jgi:hypothetical protein
VASGVKKLNRGPFLDSFEAIALWVEKRWNGGVEKGRHLFREGLFWGYSWA